MNLPSGGNPLIPSANQPFLHLLSDQTNYAYWAQQVPGASTTIGVPVSLQVRDLSSYYGVPDWVGIEITPTSQPTTPTTTTYYYDPFGQPINPATGAYTTTALPNTNPGSYDAGWLGTDQKLTEHAGGLDLVQMGARVYSPALGRFLQVDPVAGGSANAYDYAYQDSINHTDLSRMCDDAGPICVLGILMAKESLPDGFWDWLYRYNGAHVVWRNTSSGWRAVSSKGSCSVPGGVIGDTGRSFNFHDACSMHDLGYDLMRFFHTTGSHGVTRLFVDALFDSDMVRTCANRGFFTKSNCKMWAGTYSAGVELNSERQDYGVP